MSIPVRQPVKIYIKWGKARGKVQVKDALAAAISAAFTVAINATIELMVEIVPESAANKARYNPKTARRRKNTKYGSGYAGYLARRAAMGDPESLLDTALAVLTDEKRRISKLTGSDIGRLISVKFGYPSKYASYINLKRSVKQWSKTGSKTGFFGATKQIFIEMFKIALKQELSTKKAADLKLTKYIGVKSFG